jgi:hypothetical protein
MLPYRHGIRTSKQQIIAKAVRNDSHRSELRFLQEHDREGHDFSRADTSSNSHGFSRWGHSFAPRCSQSEASAAKADHNTKFSARVNSCPSRLQLARESDANCALPTVLAFGRVGTFSSPSRSKQQVPHR